ncbi:gag-pol polyprotein [Cucumis melo var. makuwa]|uniref:Gag-pol polyprotein n=1 Tax=Cucumis melo var. makuwa TaxID=1194695 RepID=A0A5D3BY43_CUCMM|nr:gag-pol polyprotein [Cucumis melo var. makuwa]TYK04427.1 gag-pol polyprotein [Cucumis melo var. makuwa]
MEIINVVVNDFESNVNQFNIEDDETHVTPDVTSTPLDEMPKGDSQPNSANTNSNITDEVINNETVLVPSAHVKKNHPSSSIIGDSSTGVTTRRKEKVDYMKMIVDLCYVSVIEPTSVENALKDEYWINVMQEELLQFKSNNVWTLVPKPDRANIIGTEWIFKNKTNESGSVIRNKACLVAQGYAQVEGVDFDETFPHVYVYTLNKALYGLKQAPWAWYERLTMYLGERGYSRGETDKTLFINKTSTDLIVAQIYVDDIIFGGFPKTLVNNFINIMKSEFEMSLVGELSCFLGLQIKQRSEGMFISQEKYAKNLVKKFGLYQSQYKKTPAATHTKITKDTIGTAVDHKLYRSMIGSLLYLIASIPDIDYAVGICVRYQSDPRTSHLNAVKRIIKYVHGTTDFRILYSYDTSSKLVGYCDAGWEGSADDRKNTFGGCFFLGNNLVSWFSKKQNCVPLSSAEAEYIVAGNGCTQMIWMKNMFK